MIHWKVYEGRPITPTSKEKSRADEGWTIVVRPQPDRTWMVAAISLRTGFPLGFKVPFVEDQSEIKEAVRQELRMLSKMGLGGEMAEAARFRLAGTYVLISREELEEWLNSIHLTAKWYRAEGKAGIYLLPFSDNVACKLSSTIGAKDDAMGRGMASMQLALVSRITGHVLNKKAQGQNHFARTTNWRQNWKQGIERIRDAYEASQGFYEALAPIKDREAYKRDLLTRIEAIPNWRNNDFLGDIHQRVEKGGVLTEKQLGAISKFERLTPQSPSSTTPSAKSRDTWGLDGGPSGEELHLFTIKGSQVVYSWTTASADIPVGTDSPYSGREVLTFEEAAKTWTRLTAQRSYTSQDQDDPPFLKPSTGTDTEALLVRMRNLYRIAERSGDEWLKEFLTNVAQQLKSGRGLSPKQRDVLDKNLSRHRMACVQAIRSCIPH